MRQLDSIWPGRVRGCCLLQLDIRFLLDIITPGFNCRIDSQVRSRSLDSFRRHVGVQGSATGAAVTSFAMAQQHGDIRREPRDCQSSWPLDCRRR